MTPDLFIKAELAAFAHQEAVDLGYDGMLAVAGIVRNRVRAGWFGGDWLEVLRRAGDVSGHGKRLEEPAPFKLGNPSFQRILREVDDVYALVPAADDFLRGGLYYFDPLRGSEPSPWFQASIIEKPLQHRRVAQVGMLWIFS